MMQKKLDQKKSQVAWPTDTANLPEYTWEQVRTEVANGQILVVVDNLVHDVTQFAPTHPGGEKMLSTKAGTNVTELFDGGAYNHSYAARNLLSMFRVGRIDVSASGAPPPPAFVNNNNNTSSTINSNDKDNSVTCQ